MEKRQKQNSGIEFDVILLLKVLLSRLWLILLAGAIAAGAAFTATKLFVKPTYRCSFTAYVNNMQVQTNKEYLSNSDLIASKELVRTYAQILTSNTILTNAAQMIDLDMPYSTLRRMVSTEIQNETEIISVYVTHTDPELAYKYANSIAATAPKHLADIVEGSSMKIVDYPQENPNRHSPGYVKISLIGFLIGALIIVIKETITFFIDDTVKDESEIEEKFSIPNLGVIPNIGAITSGHSNSYYNYKNYSYGGGGYHTVNANTAPERGSDYAEKK